VVPEPNSLGFGPLPAAKAPNSGEFGYETLIYRPLLCREISWHNRDSTVYTATTGRGFMILEPLMRTATISRQTAETQIELELNVDGSGQSDIQTGVGFFDHMLTLFTKHGAFDLRVKAVGDLHVDQHHTVEDVGICIGLALRQALGDKKGIRRYGHFTLPMEETLITSAVDLSGRYFLVFNSPFPTQKIGEFDSELVEDFWQALAANALMNLHVVLHHGRNSHHISEAIFKGTARALRMAVECDPRITGVPSTKGVI
jgi:imidazoleglycerol-phosphate dehydratase